MGAPELPNDSGDDDLRTIQIAHHPPIPSDDSDNESQLDDAYNGYQPLSMEDHHAGLGHVQLELQNHNMNVFNRDSFARIQDDREYDENNSEEIVHSDTNMPEIESVAAEIEREVWNQPRPLELQIELDGNKTQQILTAMASFQLPNLSVPDWAAGVPEERWKEELLQRIRQRTPLNDNAKMKADKERSE